MAIGSTRTKKTEVVKENNVKVLMNNDKCLPMEVIARHYSQPTLHHDRDPKAIDSERGSKAFF